MAKICKSKVVVSVLGALLVLASVLLQKLWNEMKVCIGSFGFGPGMQARGAAALHGIRDGGPAKAWYFGHELPDQLGVIVGHIFRAMLGRAFVFPFALPADLRFLSIGYAKEDNFCYDALSYMWVNPFESGFAYPTIYAGAEEVDAWIKACKQSWHALGLEEKKLLEDYRAGGKIPFHVLVPVMDRHHDILAKSREIDPLIYEDAPRYTREELKLMVSKSLNLSSWSHFNTEPPDSVLDYYESMNIRRPNEIPSTWEAIGEAIRHGRINKFDARPLVNKALVNVSFAQMLLWEGEFAKKIPVFGDGVLPTSLEEFAQSKARHMSPQVVKSPVTIADENLATVNGNPSTLDPNIRDKLSRPPYSAGPAQSGYVHTRRLPVFHRMLPEVEKLMGIDQDVLRGQSMLWMGSTPGGFHYDEEANVYLQLSGETFAFLVPQNWTDAFTGAVRHPWGSGGLPGANEVKKDAFLKQVPVYLLHLRPGDGVTLQGRTYHRFMAQTHDRIALNWFFIAGWRKMEYTPADWYSQEAHRSLERLALRQLWARSLARMYDDTGMGCVYMGFKLEYI